MMKASIIIGVLHISLALAISAYNNRGSGIAIAKGRLDRCHHRWLGDLAGAKRDWLHF